MPAAMHVDCRASVTIPRPRDVVFDFAVSDETFPKVLRTYGPIAGIAKSEVQGGPIAKGSRRRITLTDGTVLNEEILAHSPPSEHAYRWERGLRLPFALLAKSGQGTWSFSDQNGATQIEWLYRFELTSFLAFPAAWAALRLFQRWMQRGLEQIRASI